MGGVIEVRGNIFDTKMQTIVIPVNCMGVMGAGLALECKKRFPDAFVDYRRLVANNSLKIGVPCLTKRQSIPWVLHFPTKGDWRYYSEMEAIDVGLAYLIEHYQSMGITSLAVPALGCGLGNLNWNYVKLLIEMFLSNMAIPTELYPPQDRSK